MMIYRNTIVAIALSAAAILGTGCSKGSPSEQLLQEFRAKEEKKLDGFTVLEYTGVDTKIYTEKMFANRYNDELKLLMIMLENGFGFQVDEVAAKPSDRFFRPLSLKEYRVTGHDGRTIPGVVITKGESGWKIAPDFKDNIVIDKAVPAKTGVAEWIRKDLEESGKDAANNEQRSAMKAEAEKIRKDFEENLSRLTKDLGATKAWWVEYRHLPKTTAPKDSLIWNLADFFKYSQFKSEFALLSGTDLITQKSFFDGKGEIPIKESLNYYIQVLFEDKDGKLIKAVGFKELML